MSSRLGSTHFSFVAVTSGRDFPMSTMPPAHLHFTAKQDISRGNCISCIGSASAGTSSPKPEVLPCASSVNLRHFVGLARLQPLSGEERWPSAIIRTKIPHSRGLKPRATRANLQHRIGSG